MSSKYYDSSGKEVYDGEIAYAADINTINSAVNTAFEQVETDIDQVNDDADQWAAEAEKWAEESENVEVESGKYSAKHYSLKAAASASGASVSASAASSSASSASTSASTATTQAGLAATAKTNAETAETNAETAQTAAEAAQTAAEAAQTAAETAETNAETAETNAETAEDMAQEWAEKAEDSAITDNPGSYSALHWAAKAQGYATNSPYPIDTLEAKGSVSGAVACDASSYDTFTMTIAGATTISFSNLATGRTIALIITNAGSNITWPSSVKWPEGTEPTWSTSGTDRVVFQQVATSNIQGASGGIAYA